jgi:hypothetical protein
MNALIGIYCVFFYKKSTIKGHRKVYKNEQRAKTPKLGKAELWFFALHFYLIIKFCDDISYSFRVLSRIKFKV